MMKDWFLISLLWFVSVCNGQYLYQHVPTAQGVVNEYSGEPVDDFFDYSSPGIVEFYSPHCVRKTIASRGLSGSEG
jgi:hypothetical protein